MDERLKAQTLLLGLNQSELIALRSILRGESLRQLAVALSMGEVAAETIKQSMKGKIGAVRDADAVRVALHAGLLENDE